MIEVEDSRTRSALVAAIVRILKPLVRVLLRHGAPYGAFADLARRVYVDVASSDEFRIGRRKQTISRVAVLTGLTRKEVRRVAELPVASGHEESERYNRAARVVAGWISDARFVDGLGNPRTLRAEDEFPELVRLHSGDMPPRAVLDELRRVGAVEQADDLHVRLVQRAYIPSSAQADKLQILGADVAALAATVDHNMTCAEGEAWFQRKVRYDNLPAEALPVLRRLAAGEGQRLLELLNAEMRTHDRDATSGVEGSGRKQAMLGIYWHESDVPDEPEEDPS
jgi:hypothetical protein